MKIFCSHTDVVLLTDLKPHPKNPNVHPKKQIKLLAKIMREHGVRNPIVVSNRSGFMTKGHGRLLAAQLNEWEKFPVDRQDYANEAEELADMVADNKIQELSELDEIKVQEIALDLGKDFDFELFGTDEIDVASFVTSTGNIPDDEVPEVSETEEPKTKLGDIYILGEHRLMCGDSTLQSEVEKLLDGQKADMAYCDPPYGANIINKSGTLGGTKPFGNIGNMVGKAVKAGVYAPIIGDETTDTAKNSFGICSQLCETLIFWGAQYYAEFLPPNSGWIVWDKQTDGSLGDGELAYSNAKKAIRIFAHKWSGMIKASEHGQRRVHPTQKPIALAEWCFANYGKPQTVLDLFGGSGSTLIACEKTNRKCFMMELDPHYCDVIVNRWEKFTGQTAKLLR